MPSPSPSSARAQEPHEVGVKGTALEVRQVWVRVPALALADCSRGPVLSSASQSLNFLNAHHKGSLGGMSEELSMALSTAPGLYRAFNKWRLQLLLHVGPVEAAL